MAGKEKEYKRRPPPPGAPTVAEATFEYAQGVFDLRFLDGSARAVLTMNDGKTTNTFQWYHDEITYVPKDFVGKTMEQIRAMHQARDVAYLQER